MASPVTIPALLAALREATAAELGALLTELDRGMPVWQAAQQRDQPDEAVAAAGADAPPAPVKPAIPTAASYRMDPSLIRADRCQARLLGPDGGDKRWSPAVYYERQCGKAPASLLPTSADLPFDGSSLCTTCQKRAGLYTACIATGSKKISSNSSAGGWNGLITEAPLDRTHMLGTAWAETKKPRWHGDDSASESGSASSGGRSRLTPEERIVRAETKLAARVAAATLRQEAKSIRAATKAAEKETKKAEKAAKAAAKKGAVAFLLPMST